MSMDIVVLLRILFDLIVDIQDGSGLDLVFPRETGQMKRPPALLKGWLKDYLPVLFLMRGYLIVLGGNSPPDNHRVAVDDKLLTKRLNENAII